MAFNSNANYLPPSPVVPAQLTILGITQTNPMLVTTDSFIPSNVYIPGQLVRFSVPSDYGMYQVNGLTGSILAVNGVIFTIAIDATRFDPFVIPTPTRFTPAPATLAPAGSRNIYNFTTEPFHSLSNQGN